MFTCRQTRSAKILSNDLDVCREEGEIEFYIPKDELWCDSSDHIRYFDVFRMVEVGDIQLLWCAMLLCDILKSHNNCFILYLISYPNLQSPFHPYSLSIPPICIPS